MDFKSGSLNSTVSRTLRIEYWPAPALRPSSATATAQRRYRNPLFVAKEWMILLQSGKVATRTDLTKHLELSRARITQVLSVLTLAPEVLGLIEGLGDPLIAPLVTERFLRSISELDNQEQMSRVKDRILKGSSRSTRSGSPDNRSS